MFVRRILHIDLDAFFVSVERALHPKLCGKPVVVGGHLDARGVVSCASYEARAYGLKAGMPLITARRLCSQAIFLQGDFQRYREFSGRFLDILFHFSPDVEPLGLDEAYIDLTGFESLYGPADEAALRIKGRIRDELGIAASVGIASSKVVAKVASRIGKPDGLVEVSPGEERNFLAPLPLAELPCVGPKAERRLKELGIVTIGELALLPVLLLKQKFGAVGEVLHRYANGIDERRVEVPSPAKSISRETTFAKDTLDHRFLKATLRLLSEQVGAELRENGRKAKCITLKLRYADFETITRSRTLKEVSDSDQAIFVAGLELLHKALAQRHRLVRLIGIRASNLSSGRQLSMLDTKVERQERLSRALDRIRSKYGFAAIESGQTLSLRGDVDKL
jgi:DNA polymerase-4